MQQVHIWRKSNTITHSPYPQETCNCTKMQYLQRANTDCSKAKKTPRKLSVMHTLFPISDVISRKLEINFLMSSTNQSQFQNIRTWFKMVFNQIRQTGKSKNMHIMSYTLRTVLVMCSFCNLNIKSHKFVTKFSANKLSCT